MHSMNQGWREWRRYSHGEGKDESKACVRGQNVFHINQGTLTLNSQLPVTLSEAQGQEQKSAPQSKCMVVVQTQLQAKVLIWMTSSGFPLPHTPTMGYLIPE